MPRPYVSPDTNGPHRGVGSLSSHLSPKPTISTTRGPGADAALAATRKRANALRYAAEQQRFRAMGFGSGTNIVAKAARDLGEAAINTPAGIYGLGKATVHDVRRNPALAAGVLPGIVYAKARHRAVAPDLTAVGKGMAKQTYQDVRHPLRHPGYTLLDALAVLSAGAGTATRLAAAGDAARAAEGAGRLSAALSRSSAEGGSLLRRPLPPARIHLFEGQPIRGRYSENAGARLVQQAHDRATIRRAERVAKASGSKRVSTVSATKAERLLSEERRVTDAAMKGPALRALALSHRLSDPEDAAIRVVAEGLPVDQVIEAHLHTASTLEKELNGLRRGGVPGGGKHVQLQIRIASGARDNLIRKAQTLEEAKKYLSVDTDGRPILNPLHPGHARLQRIYDAAERAALTRETRLRKAGLLTTEAAESRVHGPGRFYRGRSVSGGRAVAVSRPRTVAEAEARAAELEADVNRTTQRVVDFLQKRGAGNAMFRADEKATRGTRRVRPEDVPRTRSGKVDIARMPQGEYVEPGLPQKIGHQTGMEKAWSYAERGLYERGKRPGAHPLHKAYAEKSDELHAIRTALNVAAEKGTPFEGMTEGGSLGTVTEFHPQSEFVGGRFRVPDVLPTKGTPHGPIAYRGGVPRKPGTLTHEYTAALRKSGEYTKQSVRATAEDALQAERYLSVERFRARVVPMGHAIRPEDSAAWRRTHRFQSQYVPVRERPLTSGEATKLRKVLQGVEPDRLSPDEAARIDEAISSLKEGLFPEQQYGGTQVGEHVPGITWVDRRLLGSQRKLVGSLGPLDTVQDAIKGLVLYGKPGYVVPNVGGNVLYNVIQQGFLAPYNWNRAVRLNRELGFQVDEVMGEGYARALAEGTRSPVTGAVQKAGNFWSKFVDVPFRRAAFLHEAAKFGAKTDAQVQQLLTDGRFGGRTIGEIAQRARDSIVDYERLGPIERDIVRRVLFVYPWIKGSTYYAAQFLRDHPIQAYVFAQLGKKVSAENGRVLGPLPAWAKGSIPVFKHNGRQFVVNPTSASPFSTPADVLTAGGGLFHTVQASEDIGQMASPVAQAAIEAGFGRDLFTGAELKGGAAKVFGKQLVTNLPQYQLVQRLLRANSPKTQGSAYPYGYGSAAGQFLGGSSMPRPVNLETLNQQAVNYAPDERVAQKIAVEQKAVIAGLAKTDLLSENPTLRSRVVQAYSRKAAVDEMRARVRHEYGHGEPYQRAALAQETSLLLKWKVISKSKAAEITAVSKSGSEETVREWREALQTEGFSGAYLELLAEARQAAGVK